MRPRYKCANCNLFFFLDGPDEEALLDKAERHDKTCKKCRRGKCKLHFVCRQDLVLHLYHFHSHLRPSKGTAFGRRCVDCFNYFPSKEAVIEHYESDHLDTIGEACMLCDELVSDKLQMVRHLTEHEEWSGSFGPLRRLARLRRESKEEEDNDAVSSTSSSRSFSVLDVEN